MVAVKAHFDGKQIVLPEQLQGAVPQEVVVVLEDLPTAAGQNTTGSIFDAIGKASRPRTAEEIHRQVREDRDSCGDR